MIFEVSALMGQIIAAVAGWVNEVFSSMDAVRYYLPFFAIFACSQLLLIPLRGSGSSDTAKRRDNSKKDGG